MSDDQNAELEQLFGLTGKAAMVIGGGQGMGESTSRLLALAGCDVAVVDIVADRAQRVADRVGAMGRRGVAIVGDILDSDNVTNVVGEAERQLGGLDVMVSIVGQASWNSVLDMTLEQWDLDHRRNLRGFFVAAQAVAKSCVARGVPGAITAITSVSGIQSAPRHAAYGAAKAGLINLVKTMAVELAPHDIRVNAIAPGTIKTPRSSGSEEFDKSVASSLIPFKRRGEPDDIGKAALFLSSDLARYITGHNLSVDGGWTAAWLIEPPR